MVKDNFQDFSQKFESDVWDLDNQKWFCSCKYISGFENFKEGSSIKEKFCGLLIVKKATDKEHEFSVKVLYAFEMKTMQTIMNRS